MGHTADCADIQKPNRRPALQNTWVRVVTKEPALIVSQAAAPAVLYYMRTCEQPTDDVITSAEVQVGRQGIGLLDRPGIWYVYFVAPATTPVREYFILRPVKDPATALAFMQLNALAQAFDLVKWGGTAVSAAQAASADAGFAAALVAPPVNARLGFFNTVEYVRAMGGAINALNGIGQAAFNAMAVASAVFGRDTGDSTMRPIETRAAATGQSAALYRLLTDAVSRGYEFIQGTYQPQAMLEDASGAQVGAAYVHQSRESGYASSRRGRRFLISGEGTGIVGTNGFTATIPQVLIVAGAAVDFIIRKIKISQSIVAGTPPLLLRIVLDTANRYSSGGTSRTPMNMNGGSVAAAGFTQVRDGAAAITATAAGGGTREMGVTVLKTLVGEPYEREFDDGLIVPSSGSGLIYVYSGAASGTFHYEIEGEEVNVQ